MNIYIHIPFCLKKCHYCVFPTHIIGKQQDNLNYFKETIENKYISALLKDIEQHYKAQKQIQTLYFGGGTPSLLSSNSLEKILNSFSLNNKTEITIEADPGTFFGKSIGIQQEQDNEIRLKELKLMGFNRLSIGVQSLNQTTLKYINRNHTLQQTMEAINAANKVFGLDKCSFDLLYNLPEFINQTQFDDIETCAKQMRVGHLSLYSLQIEENSFFYNQLNYREEKHPLPNNDIQAENFRRVHHILNDYDHYEVSNFALDEKYQSQHNKAYWKGDQEFYGFGMGATSLLNQQRITRPKRLKSYFKFIEDGSGCTIEDEGSVDEHERVLLMSRLRTKWGIEKNILRKKTRDKLDCFSQYFKTDKYYYKLIIPDGYLVCDELIAQCL